MRSETGRAGFTLIEIIVAMTILVVIMVIMAQLFHQSSVAWDGGLRQVEMSMEGRSALNLMAGELSHALADDLLRCSIGGPGGEIQFYTTVEPDATNRSVSQVRYMLVGTQLQRTEVPVIAAAPPYPHGEPDAGLANVPVVDHVLSLAFVTPAGVHCTTSLPRWVSIRMVLEKATGTSQVNVWTLGRDGVTGTDDDIQTWED
jgi:prepilin-type N-terminal cleavage/methylation domain-containing protein